MRRSAAVLIEGFLIAIVVAIGLGFLLMALALLKGVVAHLWGRWGDYFTALESRDWATTLGKVERAAITYTHSGRGHRIYTPLVRYSYGVNGESFVSERFAFGIRTGIGNMALESIQDVLRRFPPGSQVEVHYDPKNPKRATLDRTAPPVAGPTFGWLFVLLLGGPLFFFLGIAIVRGPFEEPPDLGETPPLIAQLGGFAAAIGVVLVLVAGVRAIRSEERRQRRVLRFFEAAKPALVHEVREGELVAISGRAEELELEAEAGEGADEPAYGAPALPFEKGPLVYYDIDAEWYRRTAYSDFAVRDASGMALVELREVESTFVPSRRLPVDGAVQSFLDEQRETVNDPIPAVPTAVSFRSIKKDEPIVVVGRAEHDGDDFVFRAQPDAPESLLVAAGSREEVIARLREKSQKTRAILLVGCGLIAFGIVAMLV